MTPQRCRELLDNGVLEAFGSGKPLQRWRHPGVWLDAADDPTDDDSVKWRVKPEPREWWGLANLEESSYASLYTIKSNRDSAAERHPERIRVHIVEELP
jgi:hypothetical protein